MHKKVYLLEYNKKNLIYHNCLFAFRNKRTIEYVKRHIQHDEYCISQLLPNRFLLKTQYNTDNEFNDDRYISSDSLHIEEKRLYHLLDVCTSNNLELALVEATEDREDGDLEIITNNMKKKKTLGKNDAKFNLEVLWKVSPSS
jgi:hypothetical protein